MTQIQYKHEPDAKRIVATKQDGEEVGKIEYTVNEKYWNANHTWVNPDYRGHSIARKLVDTLTDTARAEGVWILPTCSYARHVMEKDAAFADVLFKQDSL
ncbi:MAG TPA: GNAT family N-acetyltransferase [Anaerolineaceae bacterium]|nr:GNAT family N-acetyltransferase [Anaerolineaceae bacterium]